MFDEEPPFATGPRWAWVLLCVATVMLAAGLSLGSPRNGEPWPGVDHYAYLPGVAFAVAGLALRRQVIGILALIAAVALLSVSANLQWPGNHLLLGTVPAIGAVFAVGISLLSGATRRQFSVALPWWIVGAYAVIGGCAVIFPI